MINTYEGEIHEGQRHGRGTLFKDNGDCFKGTFSKGAPVVGTAIFEDSGKHHLSPSSFAKKHGLTRQF